jgi:membrane associated rhomboid family serine protease
VSAHDDLQHCYRHPDRETALACSNCGRAICPECMTATPVGQRCPECIGQQKTQVRRPSSMAYATPFVTYALIAACVLMFLGPQKGLSSGLVVGGGGISQQSLIDFALAGPPVANGDWWRMVTSMFLHGSIIHLGFNMYALWIFGPAIERRFGAARYLALYFTAGLWGSAGALILSPNGYTVGASGAIFGLMGAFVAIAKVQGARDLGGVGAMIAINLVFTFAVPGISIGGHLGGLAGGLLCGAAYELLARRTRGSTTQILGVLAAVALSAIALVVGIGAVS